ncbi:hypothetical protein TC41_0999 [Alicyclobacillus acidocaldarius subsp. acidocaldarius Tc-4-1]|uniref:Uncharacterized protein n=1 Tax=Alicyclobacillus acidocaldarius (strain Tc-4-1) TaxID=1048834 RepID=F8IFY0_ALIAT|nr:hypothetical protein TC41_0999 [Alicyclobacillus acidocaldarius subsp. acidocaldarius Tc-4-1]
MLTSEVIFRSQEYHNDSKKQVGAGPLAPAPPCAISLQLKTGI